MNNERHYTREVPTDFPWKLIEDITNDFDLERKIGGGGYGVVYKGVHPNGQEIAVKKLHHMPGLDEDQYQNELQILTGICHPNVVQLVGKSYIERDRCVEHQGRLVFATMIDRAICLEFLPEGSLEKHLSDEQSGLRWHNRYKIIKGICDGLKYLHGGKIFHLDLKPSNILLNKDMVPKIADFGLSRLFGGTRQSHTTKNLLCTLGYAPPEFVDKGKITNKFDIFSLGVIMIKVLAGPDGYSICSDMPDSQDFVDLVQGNWRKMLLKAGWEDASYLDAYCNQVKTCTEVALKCVESNSHKRPSIEDIISMLNETEESIGKLYQQLFVVEPSQLCFPFEPDKLIPCLVHLTNNADHDIAYRIQPNTPDIFVGSLRGIVPARSTQSYNMTMQKQQRPPPNLDTIHVQSVAADLMSDMDCMFNKAEAVDDVLKQVKIASLHECGSQLAFKGLFAGGGPAGDLSSGAVIFDMEYARWLEDDTKHMTELQAVLQPQTIDANLGAIIEECMRHYDELFHLRAMLARSDVFHLMTGLWATMAERCFLWMGGFRPSEILKMLIPQLDPLTEPQLLGMCNLQMMSEQAEDALSQGLQQLHQSLADAVGASPLSDATNVANYTALMALALDKLDALESFYHQADNLRQQTLHHMRRILTTRQTARCFLSISENHRRLRALSSVWASRPSSESVAAVAAENVSPTATGTTSEQALRPYHRSYQFPGF